MTQKHHTSLTAFATVSLWLVLLLSVLTQLAARRGASPAHSKLERNVAVSPLPIQIGSSHADERQGTYRDAGQRDLRGRVSVWRSIGHYLVTYWPELPYGYQRQQGRHSTEAVSHIWRRANRNRQRGSTRSPHERPR